VPTVRKLRRLNGLPTAIVRLLRET
jgi:hypothetical protein